MNKFCVFVFLNMLIPLVVGALIYITSGERTMISDAFAKFRLEPVHIRYPSIIRAHACDLLWGYSLCAGLYLFNTIENGVRRLFGIITAASLTAVIMESVQLLQGVPGTFDIKDIFVELFGIALAAVIIEITVRRNQNDTQKVC